LTFLHLAGFLATGYSGFSWTQKLFSVCDPMWSKTLK
jgi:hypothetical protein